MPLRNAIGLAPGILPSAGFSGGYMSKVLSIEPANLIRYYPMDEPAGSVSFDRSGKDDHGVYTGVTLGQPGIGDGRTCPLFDRTNDLNNIHSAALNTDIDLAEMTFHVWCKVSAGGWAGVEAAILGIRVDVDNYYLLRISSAANQLDILRNGAGEGVQARSKTSYSPAGWFPVAFRASENADELELFTDGVSAQAAASGLGAMTGVLNADFNVIGALNTTPAIPFGGYLAHPVLWTTALADAQIANLARL